MSVPIRTFTDLPAKRERVPLLIGLVGPSGGGKTGSALELAHGIQDIVGGEIFYVDSEANRALAYADATTFSDPNRKFKFRHVPFDPPFGPLDYLTAIEHCISKGAKIIVVDSASHEHEGEGGVLETQDRTARELAEKWKTTVEKASASAWNIAKTPRKRLINRILQLKCNFIFCFRSKEKMDYVRGKDPEKLGWQPIAGEEWIYEMSFQCLLPPGADGVPEYSPEQKGEKRMVKLPIQFREILKPHRALSIEVGRELAKWAEGGVSRQTKRQQVIQYVADNKPNLTDEQMALVKKLIPGANDPGRDDFELLSAVEIQVNAFLAQNQEAPPVGEPMAEDNRAPDSEPEDGQPGLGIF